jgi:large subunit ribosomal protein LP0
MQASVGAALANVAALSLATNYPTLASIPHSVVNGYKNVLAIAVETDYSFPLAEKVRPRQCSLLLCDAALCAWDMWHSMRR